MKQYQINNAYMALSRLANMQMPVRDAYNLYMFTEKIKPIYNFELEQEERLIRKYGVVIDPDTGKFAFKDKESAVAFRDEINALNNLEVDTAFEPITINMEILGNQKIMPADIMALNGFVVFE